MVKLVRVKKYERFVKLLKEHFGGCATGIDRDLGIIWFKVEGKKVCLDVWFRNFYGNRVWGGDKFMVYEVHYIRVLSIGEKEFPYRWFVQDVSVPANGYIHEESELYSFLQELALVAKVLG